MLSGVGCKHVAADEAVIDLGDPRSGTCRLLIGRNRGTGELAYYCCHSPTSAVFELPRLFIGLAVRPARDTAHLLGWSDWRRHHHARSQASRRSSVRDFVPSLVVRS
ncbi:hypothetical protein GXW82_11505 [Streptacidiphilus sp. 4-A2]|nr:hypothetical protein [Streptacidiphilus sp. 4-A2]